MEPDFLFLKQPLTCCDLINYIDRVVSDANIHKF